MGRLDGIPVTTLARTFLDIAESEPYSRLERALDQAERMGVLNLLAIEQVIQRNPGRRGTPPLRSALRTFDPLAARTNEGLERDLLRLLRDYDLPAPEVNASVGPYVVDFLWREQRLLVEADSYRYHGGRAAFERDRKRDIDLQRAGYRVIRLTHRRLIEEPAVVAEELRFFLSVA